MHYPILEKPGAQNIAVFENQGKQRELSYPFKTLFWEKSNGMMQKRQKN